MTNPQTIARFSAGIMLLTALALAMVLLAGSMVRAEDWPRFRGPRGDGHTSETNLPVKWDKSHVAWRIALPGEGQSSPITWGDRLFLTCATEGGAQRLVLCLDRHTGKTLWQRAVKPTLAGATLHKMNSHATPSCATDGKVVIAFFGEAGLHAFDIDGKSLWSRDLGKFPGDWGTAASPIIVGDTVIQNCDAEGDSYLIALSKSTGETVWKTERPATPKGGWSTPVLIDVNSKTQMLLNGEFGIQSYDPATGAKLWFCKGFNGRGSPMPVFGHGLVIVVNGKPGDLYAVKPDGSGDVTQSHMAWHTPRGSGRDLPSPVLIGDLVFTVNMMGIARCNDATTGSEIYKDRLADAFSAAPVAANGLVYQLAESGTMFVIRPGAALDVVAENALGVEGEIFRASPTPAAGLLYLRSNKALYCIGKERAAE